MYFYQTEENVGILNNFKQIKYFISHLLLL